MQNKFAQDIKDKLAEAEEQFRELEVKIRKEFKNEKKTLVKEHDEKML